MSREFDLAQHLHEVALNLSALADDLPGLSIAEVQATLRQEAHRLHAEALEV